MTQTPETATDEQPADGPVTHAAESLINQDFIRDPYATYASMREQSPIRLRQQNGSVLWMVTRYEQARALLADPRLRKDPRAFPNSDGSTGTGPEEDGMELLSRHMLNSDPPDHTRLRKLVTKGFTARPTESFRPRIEELVAELLDGFEGRTEIDVINDYAVPLSTTVICELIGIPLSDSKVFHGWYSAMTGVATLEESAGARKSMIDYLRELIATKRAEPADDLVSGLLQARDESDLLTETEVMSMVFLLLGAGHETTVSFIGTAVHALLGAPDQLAALRSDPGLLPGAVEELLRFESPINMATFRYAVEPVTIGEATVEVGDAVFVALGAINRDPERFAEPDRLDLTRPTSGHLAFGHGLHHCLGAPLARAEGGIAVRALIERFPDLAPARPSEQLRWRFSLMLRCLEELPVRL